MANTLMFEVGIKKAQGEYDKIYQEVMELAQMGKKGIELQIQFQKNQELTTFVNALKMLGDGKMLEPMLNKIESLQASMVRLGMIPKDLNYTALEQQLNKVTVAYENYQRARKNAGLKDGDPATSGAPMAMAEVWRVARTNLEKEFGMSENLARVTMETYKNMGNTIAESLSKATGSMDGGKFRAWAEEVQGVTRAVKELADQLKKMHQEQNNAGDTSKLNEQAKTTKELAQAKEQLASANEKVAKTEPKPTAQGNLFDPQKFTSLQEAIDKIISEINRLKEAFSGIGKIEGLSQMTTDINGLMHNVNNLKDVLSTLSSAVKIDQSSPLIKKLTADAEAAEKKIQELTEKLNAMSAAQNKVAESVAKSGKSETQVTDSQMAMFNRYKKLMADIHNIKREIVEIQRSDGGGGALGAQLGQYFSALNRVRNEIAKITSAPSLAEAISRGMSSEMLSKFSSSLAAIKSEFKEVVSGAKAFNKEFDKGSAKSEAAIRKMGMAFNELKNYMKKNGGSEEMRKLQSEIQVAIQKMRQLMNAGDYSGAIRVFERMNSTIRQTSQAIKEYERSVLGAAASNSHLSASEQQLANSIKHSTDSMRSQSQVLGDLKTLATQYLGVWGAQGFLRNVIEIGGQLEMQRLSIGAILGDMAKASELFDRIKNLAIKSPFGVVELDQMTKQLSAYGFEYPELFDMTKRLADISAATGTSVDRLALALGHVRSEAALSGYTLRQFSMANIPLAKKLSEELSKVEGKFVSVADVRKRVRTKDIGYEPVLKVLKDLTDEGGMFYNAQEIMSESVKARFKNLKDSMDIMYGEIAESKVGKSLKSVASLLTVLTRHWQELGAVLVVGAGYWAVSRLAVLASNKAMVQGNLTMGRFTAAQLEMQAQTGNLTRAQLLQAVATKKLAVADAEAAGAVLALSRAQLQHVANTGKVASAMNMATIATSKYTVSQLRFLATMRGMNLGWLGTALLGISNGFQAARVAALGFMKAMWPMLAISAIVEVFMNLKRESESFAEAANYVGQSARNMMKDIDEAINSVSRNGKPVDAESLREAVSTMKEVLEANEFYTAEQQKQVEKAVTLSEKYDVLLKQMKEMREEAEWQANSEGLVEKILANTGKNIVTRYSKKYNPQTGDFESGKQTTDFGMPFFNNSLQENVEQVNKSNSALQSAIFLLSEYQGVMKEAIDKNNGFGLSLDGKSWQEQIRLIAQSEHWDEFIASVENAGSRFEKTAANVKTASDKVVKDWESIVGDDVKAIRLTLMKEWDMTEDELNQFAKNNEQTMRWLVDAIAKSLNKLGVAETIIDEFKQKLLSLFGVAGSSKPTQRDKSEYEKQTDLGKRLMRNVLNYNKNNGKGGNGVTTVKEINEITGTGDNEKTEVEVTKALKERAQKSHENMVATKRIWGETSKQYLAAKKKYDHDLNLALSNNISESEITSSGKKGGGKTNKIDDKETKEIRERVRIMKEAAESYQYWRAKIGDSAAFDKVQGEFGNLLATSGLSTQNIDKLRENLQKLYDDVSKQPKSKARTEALKEIKKEFDQLDRKDFEKNTEEFLSKTQLQLDSLTRSWETFNSVRDATGNIELAVQLSGAGYQAGANVNLADALRKKIEGDFAAAGAIAIPFDINFSDEEIFNRIAAAMPEKTQEQIKGIVEEYKKWRDLQRDMVKTDIQNFGKLLGSVVDYQSQLVKITDEYKNQIDALERLRELGRQGKPGGITDAQYQRAANVANANLQRKTVEALPEYKMLMDGVKSMTAQTAQYVKSQLVNSLNAQLRRGAITAKEYADKIKEINKKLEELQKPRNNVFAYMSGGLNGIIQKRQEDGEDMVRQGAEMQQNAQRLIDDSFGENGSFDKFMGGIKQLQGGKDMVAAGEGMQTAAGKMATTVAIIDTIVHGIDDAIQGLNDAYGSITKMLDALGNESASDPRSGWGKVGTALSALSAGSSSATKAWDSLKNGNIGGVISGVIGSFTEPITVLAQAHDARRERQIEDLKREVSKIDNTLNLIKSLRERELGYDSGNLRRQLAAQYEGQEEYMDTPFGKINLNKTATEMYEYYSRGGLEGSGYQQELNALKKQREMYQEMYEAENDKKKSSQDALDEYKQKMAELDEQIMFFVEDLANELWGIDFKAWASQISDALWTAFENGEDALDAFHEEAKDIISDVAKRMMNIHLIEPIFNKLEERLFGKMENGKRVGGAAYNYDTGQFNENETLKILGEFFGESGEFAKVINSAEDFYNMAKTATGFDFGEDSKGSGRSSSTISKAITEEQSNLLIALVNTIRADVSVNRTMIAQYFPLYYQTLTSSNETLGSIAMNTRAIMESNATIAQRVSNLDDSINGLKNRVWRLPVS